MHTLCYNKFFLAVPSSFKKALLHNDLYPVLGNYHAILYVFNQMYAESTANITATSLFIQASKYRKMKHCYFIGS